MTAACRKSAVGVEVGGRALFEPGHRVLGVRLLVGVPDPLDLGITYARLGRRVEQGQFVTALPLDHPAGIPPLAPAVLDGQSVREARCDLLVDERKELTIGHSRSAVGAFGAEEQPGLDVGLPRTATDDVAVREAAGDSSPSVAYATGVPTARTARAAAAVSAVCCFGPVRPFVRVKWGKRGKAGTFVRSLRGGP